jgi:hypothetical protein
MLRVLYIEKEREREREREREKEKGRKWKPFQIFSI